MMRELKLVRENQYCRARRTSLHIALSADALRNTTRKRTDMLKNLNTHASHVMLLEILTEGNWILDVSIGTGNLILLTLLTLPEPTSHLSYSTYTSCQEKVNLI